MKLSRKTVRGSLALAGAALTLAAVAPAASASTVTSYTLTTGSCRLIATFGNNDYATYYLSYTGGNGTQHCTGYFVRYQGLAGADTTLDSHGLSSGSYSSPSVYFGGNYHLSATLSQTGTAAQTIRTPWVPD